MPFAPAWLSLPSPFPAWSTWEVLYGVSGGRWRQKIRSRFTLGQAGLASHEEGKLMALPSRIKRLALVPAGVPLVAAMATVMSASPSLAASQSARAVLTVQGSSDPVYHTLAHGLHVRTAPTTAA